MQKFNIKCPKCQKSFTLKVANVAAVANKSFKCPNCGTSTAFAVLFKMKGSHTPVTQDLHTHIGGPAIGGPANHMATHAIRMPKLIVQSSGSMVHLPIGSHLMGRDSIDSPAEIKVAPDPYMSRRHARVIVGNNGGQVICQIQSLDSVNRIFINDRVLQPGETATLNNGDVLLLGMTKVKYLY